MMPFTSWPRCPTFIFGHFFLHPPRSYSAHSVLIMCAFLYVTDNGKLYAQLNIGLTEKTIVVGEGLGDDMWHSVKLERRAMVITFSVDDERPLIGTIFPTFFPLPQFSHSTVSKNWKKCAIHCCCELVPTQKNAKHFIGSKNLWSPYHQQY